MFVYTLLYLLIPLSAERWLMVERNTDIFHNMDTTPLQIQTDSQLGSGESLFLQFHDSRMRIEIRFSDIVSVTAKDCVVRKEITLSEEQPVVWTIVRNTTERFMKILQNGEEVLFFDYSKNGDCNNHTWDDGSDITNFKFLVMSRKFDNASDAYRAMPTGTFIEIKSPK